MFFCSWELAVDMKFEVMQILMMSELSFHCRCFLIIITRRCTFGLMICTAAVRTNTIYLYLSGSTLSKNFYWQAVDHTTCLESLEMSGNLTAVRESVSKNFVRENWPKTVYC